MGLPSSNIYAEATFTNPSSDLTDFTLYVDLSEMPSGWWNEIDTSDVERLRVSDDSGNELPRDVVSELFVDNNDGTGEGSLYVKWSGTMSSTGTLAIRIYPPQSSMSIYATSDTYGQFNAHGSSASNFWAMHEDPSGGVPQIKDRTSSATHGTTSGSMTSGDSINGVAGKCLEYDGNDDEVSVGDLASHTSATFRFWWYRGSTGSRTRAIHSDGGVTMFQDQDAQTASFFVGDYSDNARTDSNLSVLEWHHIVMAYDGSTLRLYVDGVLQSDTGSGGSSISPSSVELGTGGGDAWLGRLDEIGYLGQNVGQAWVDTDFAMYDDQSTFYSSWIWRQGPSALTASRTSGSESSSIDLSWSEPSDTTGVDHYRIERESPVGGGFSSVATVAVGTTSYTDSGLSSGTVYNYRVRSEDSGDTDLGVSNEDSSWTVGQYVQLNIDHTKVDGNLTDYPAFIDLSDMPSSFWQNVSADGGGIRVSTDTSYTSPLPREIRNVDTINETGEMYVKIPSLSSSSDTTIYIHYGTNESEPAVDSTYGSENVWNSDFEAMWHMEEDPSGTSPQIVDSTSNGHDGESSGSMTSGDLVSTKVGNGLDFDGSDDQILCGDLGSPAAFTQYFWSWRGSTSSRTRWTGTNLSGFTAHQNADDHQAFFRVGDNHSGDGYARPDAPIGVQEWHHIAITTNGSTFVLYVDGVAQSTTGTVKGSIDLSDLEISNAGDTWLGKLDEWAVVTKEYSSSWIKTVYNNQNSPSTFYTTGSSPGGGEGESGQNPSIFFGFAA